jgi:hypothetical protein
MCIIYNIIVCNIINFMSLSIESEAFIILSIKLKQ